MPDSDRRRIALCTVISAAVVLATATLGGPVGASCDGALRGVCSYGVIDSNMDCSCDPVSCPPNEGPPQFFCVREDCSRNGILAFYCSGEGFFSWSCVAGSEVNPDLCSCGRNGIGCMLMD